MARKQDDLAELLRKRGVRKKVARQIGALDGNKRRAGAKGEKLARQTVDDLSSAADEIRDRVLSGDANRRKAARKAANTRKRTRAKRRTAAKKAAKTRTKVARARGR
jgi:hypothetical protein